MDIIFSEKEKQIIRITEKLLRKRLGKNASAERIQEEMLSCANDAVRKMSAIICGMADKVKPKHQHRIMKDYPLLTLWMCLHDTAYRDVFFATLDEILKHAVTLRKMIKPFVKKSDDWYPNVWHESKILTQKLRDEGKIPDYEHSLVERQCVPSKHREDLKNILKKMSRE